MVEGDKNLDIERIRDKLSELQSRTSDQRSERHLDDAHEFAFGSVKGFYILFKCISFSHFSV